MTERRRLLLITFHFPPSAASGSFRTAGFARHLPTFGWDVDVVSAVDVPLEPVDRGLLGRIPRETSMQYIPYPTGLAPRLLRRWARHELWLPRAWRACRQVVMRRRPQVVLTSGPPHCVHLLGYYLKRRFQLPWIVDLRDPWVTDRILGERRTLRARWERMWERRVFHEADAVLANAPRASDGLKQAFPMLEDKIYTVTNGFDPEDFPPPTTPRDAGPLRLLHAGELYAGRDPGPLLEALMQSNAERGTADRPIRLRLLGRADPLETPAEQDRLASLVEHRGQVSHAEALEEMASSDILVLFDTPGRRIGVPAKLYEYLGAGRPILALAEPDGDTAWVLEASGATYRIAPPGDVPAIRRALAELVDIAASTAPSQRATGDLLLFTRESMARRLAEISGRLSNGEANAPGADGAASRERAPHRQDDRRLLAAGRTQSIR